MGLADGEIEINGSTAKYETALLCTAPTHDACKRETKKSLMTKEAYTHVKRYPYFFPKAIELLSIESVTGYAPSRSSASSIHSLPSCRTLVVSMTNSYQMQKAYARGRPSYMVLGLSPIIKIKKTLERFCRKKKLFHTITKKPMLTPS